MPIRNADLLLPWFTSQVVILSIFIGALCVFHIILVRVRPLSSIGWKRVDYIWLSMAILGLIGTITSTRLIVSKNYLSNMGYSRIQGAFNFVKVTARLGMNEGFCGKVVPASTASTTPLKPSPDGFEEQCVWFRKVVASLQQLDPNNREPIIIKNLVGKRPAGGDGWIYENFFNSVAGYNDTLKRVAALEEGSKLSDFEELMQVLGPHLLAVALALRMTKVTGEIALDRSKSCGMS